MLTSLEAIRDARSAIAGRVHRTPILGSATLGRRTGGTALLKPECLQRTGSFKVRGALNRVGRMSPDEKARGLVAISAGNHAQAVAFAATAAGVRSTVVMPGNASRSKAEASRQYGAEVILHGTVADAWQKAVELQEAHGLTFVHPFDDADVIAGQGTVGLEIMEDVPDPDVVVVPVGGGGLISGVAAAIKRIHPITRVIGVEPEGAAAVRAALDAGHVVKLEEIRTIADGLAAPYTADYALDHVRQLVDDVVTVSDEEIAEGLRFLLERTKIMVEPAGAAAVAALLAGRIQVARGATVVAVLSGGNIDLDRLRELLPGGTSPRT